MTSATSKKPDIHKSWLKYLESEFSKEYMKNLKAFLQEEKKSQKIYPPGNLIFNALNLTPLDQVKVVIIGQDPYHNPGQAHGLSFSVPRGVKVPPSLMNIFKELKTDLDIPIASHGFLESWAKQGVLMLNAVLTVRKNQPGSHANRGWEEFTDAVIKTVAANKQNVVFVLWGNYALKKAQLINIESNIDKHLVIKSPHPSPFSAHSGFFGSNPFSKINKYLINTGQIPIDWRLPE
jgi:uracil-DNA glycosylase